MEDDANTFELLKSAASALLAGNLDQEACLDHNPGILELINLDENANLMDLDYLGDDKKHAAFFEQSALATVASSDTIISKSKSSMMINHCAEKSAFVETSTPADDDEDDDGADFQLLLSKSDFNYEIDLINEDFGGFLTNELSSSFVQLTQSQSTSQSQPPVVNNIVTSFLIDDYVCINETKYGHVKYQGTVHFAFGLFCGVELEEAVGKHDGQIDGKR